MAAIEADGEVTAEEKYFSEFAMQQEYDRLEVLDFPKRNQMWPSDEQLREMPTANYALQQVRFKQFDNIDALSAIQLYFKNGNESPMFGVSSSSDHTLQTIDIDTTRDIRYVSVKIKGRYPYTGLRFLGENEQLITEYSWDDGKWTSPQEIPLG